MLTQGVEVSAFCGAWPRRLKAFDNFDNIWNKGVAEVLDPRCAAEISNSAHAACTKLATRCDHSLRGDLCRVHRRH